MIEAGALPSPPTPLLTLVPPSRLPLPFGWFPAPFDDVKVPVSLSRVPQFLGSLSQMGLSYATMCHVRMTSTSQHSLSCSALVAGTRETRAMVLVPVSFGCVSCVCLCRVCPCVCVCRVCVFCMCVRARVFVRV